MSKSCRRGKLVYERSPQKKKDTIYIMLSMSRASLRGLMRRQLSQMPVKQALGPKNLESVEEGGLKGDLKKFGKYLAIIVPSLLFTAVTTQIINHKGTKDAMESIFPAYVDFVRRNVGFDEEDLEAIERARIIGESIAAPVNLTVTLKVRNDEGVREVLHLDNVKGLTTFSELMDQVHERFIRGELPALYSRVDSEDPNSFLQNIDISLNFADSPAHEATEDKNPYSPYSLLRRERRELLNSLSAEQAAVSATARSYIDSQWKCGALPGIDAISITERDLVEAGKVKSEGAIATCATALNAKFYNIAVYLNHGIHIYKTYVSANNSSILDTWVSHHGARLAYSEKERKVNASLSSSARKTSNDKMRALGRIKELESRLERLKGEMGVGMRPIDDVEAEIKDAQTEIAQLKRNWVNRFYFF